MLAEALARMGRQAEATRQAPRHRGRDRPPAGQQLPFGLKKMRAAKQTLRCCGMLATVGHREYKTMVELLGVIQSLASYCLIQSRL